MKKVTEPEFKRYRIVRLFKDDLDELLHIFNSMCERTKIVIDGYELSDISQLINIKKQRITDFSLSGHLDDPHQSASLSLSLTSKKASLYLSDNTNTILLGIASQIECILSRRKSISRFFVHSKVRTIGSVIFYFLFGIFIETAFSYSWSNDYIYISKLSYYFAQHLALMFLAIMLAALSLIWTV